MPQLAVDDASHCPDELQQPVQFVASQPVLHAPPLHAPLPPPQLAQRPPPAPQSLGVVPGWHASLSSQQPPQFADPHEGGVTHCRSSQTWLAEHDTQARPPAPQAVLIVPGWHVLVGSMQPAQAEPQRPSWQTLPLVHAAQNAPPVPQDEALVPGKHATDF
jgi:hypothetical protein